MAKKKPEPKPPTKAPGLTFENLVASIRGVDQELAAQAKRAVNLSTSPRIVETLTPQSGLVDNELISKFRRELERTLKEDS